MDANIQKYQAFVETVRTGSFTRAARSLSYTQSGVSRMIADLERDWGMTLLERSRAGVTLTSEGRAVLPFVEGVCDDYRRLESQIDDLNGLAAGSIRIGTFSSVATHILPKVIGRFQKGKLRRQDESFIQAHGPQELLRQDLTPAVAGDHQRKQPFG